MSTPVSLGPRTPIGDVVRSAAVTVDAKATLKEVATVLGDLGIGMVVVMDHDSVVGVVSERDLVWAIAREAVLDEVWAADIMTTDVVTVEPALSVADTAALMAAQNARHVLVVAGTSPAVVSIRDLIEYLIE